MKRLLITGASGFLGWNICRMVCREWDVFGVVHSHAVQIPNVRVVRMDLACCKETKQLFHEIQPHAVIHAAAISNPNTCQLHPSESRKINVDASINIAGLCADYAAPCVFTSSDLVFDGLNPPYREEDPVSPVNAYGEQKALAEEAMLKRCPQMTVCRLPLMFGDPGPASSSFIQPMIRAILEGRELRLFIDEYRTPISARDAVLGLLLALEKAKGILHLGGIERISRYDFGRLLVQVLRPANVRLVPCAQEDMVMPAPRSRDVSLDSSKAFSLGFKPGPLREELEALFPDVS